MPERDILIGVHVTGAAQALDETLVSLHQTTPTPFRILLLIDPAPGHREALTAELAALGRIAKVEVPMPGGAPASFNRLVAGSADIYVFMECGVRPAAGWLTCLLAALDAHPENGLAGPSTNRSWNEQGVAPRCGTADDDIERQAAMLRQTHGTAWRSMAPLHSLSDFCLAIRSDVVSAVGAADIAYGRGPCWEMDYGVRAARAGFRSVWTPAAFVHRGPVPGWRRDTEERLMETNKRLYQDRFCGRRARLGAKAPYHRHCLGEACTDFAPTGMIRISLPLPRAPEPLDRVVSPSLPLVSCIMPTRGRPRYVAQSIAYFRRQDYANRELIIIYDDETDLPGPIGDARIRTVRSTRPSIGEKRNDGLRVANGEIIAHWDDDDWYAPQRLSRQVMPIAAGVADVTGLTDTLFMVQPAGEFWSVSPELYARLFVEAVHGGTLVYRRDIWRRSGPYPAISLREDAEFLIKARRDGARLCRISGNELYVYVRHAANTWKFSEGRYLQQNGWSRVSEPGFFAPDRAFYLGSARRAEVGPALVSCIMPTANRHEFVPRAIEQFLSQDYPARELIVIDDGTDSVAEFIPAQDAVRYIRLDQRVSLGTKRNMACDMARGELIAHWDDDDWMAPGWLSSQVETLTRRNADLCGLDKVFFYAPKARQAWRYVYDGTPPWAYGGTLCYTKELWRRRPFADINVGEDNDFVWSTQLKRIAINDHGHRYVATVHRHNSSPKLTTGHRWHSIPASDVEQMMLAGKAAREDCPSPSVEFDQRPPGSSLS